MFNAPHSTLLTDRVRRWLALGCTALVLALTISAASPAAHGLLHSGNGDGTTDDACAVVMFASGVALPVGPISIAPPETLTAGISPVTAAEIFLVSPRYLRQPERGPPASVVG